MTAILQDLSIPVLAAIAIKANLFELFFIRRWRETNSAGSGMPDFVKDVFFNSYSDIGFEANLPVHHISAVWAVNTLLHHLQLQTRQLPYLIKIVEHFGRMGVSVFTANAIRE
jgi:hypothetical protein